MKRSAHGIGFGLGRAAGIPAMMLVFGTAGCDAASRHDAAASSSTEPAAIEPQLAPAPATPPPPAPSTATRPGTVRLARSTHPFARPELDRGRLDPEKRLSNLSIAFKLTDAQRADRDALAAAQLDPSSPLYHHWLTPESYRARFGAAPEDLTAATAWLKAQGLEVHRVSPLGARITFSGTVSQIEAAFQTEMHRYQVGSTMHYAMGTAPALPQHLADVALGLYNTHDFVPRPVSQRAMAEASRRIAAGEHPSISWDSGTDAGSFNLLGPGDWATAYDVTRLYSPGIGGKTLDGTGVTIGIVGTAPVAQSDIDAFRAQFGLPASKVTQTLVPNTGAPSSMGFGGGIEAILDLEWSGGIAKGATINYVYTGQNDFNVDDATFYLIEENLAPVMSESYGGCEGGILPSDADVTEMLGTAGNLMGITHTASSGDSGAADCGASDVSGGFGGQSGLYVDIPGAFPSVTSVGGTQFPSPLWSGTSTLVDAGLEQVWNEENNPYSQYGVGAGGGGISMLFPRPAYQSGLTACTPVGTLPTPTTQPMRQVPDVALSAASGTPGYFIECTMVTNQFGFADCSATGGSPTTTAVGGTSAASPTFAAVVAILNQAVGDRLGNINPMLYQLESQTPSVFHDITSGNNEVVCGPGASDSGEPEGGVWPEAGCGSDGLYGYAAAPGYDCASGIGSIDAYDLVSAWLGAVKTDVELVPNPTATSEGDMVTLTANVTVPGGGSTALGGSVTFAFQSYTDSCSDDLSWDLGSATITNGTSTGGTATLTTVIPPGLVVPGRQAVDLVALYGGDAHHLASQSAKVKMPFSTVSFAVSPPTLSLQPNGTKTFAATGGVMPSVRWFVITDTTAGFSMATGFTSSSIDESAGAFIAGANPGYVVVRALDGDGAEALSYITVGSPTTPPPWQSDGGVSECWPEAGAPDAGPDATAVDSGAPTVDAGEPQADASTPGSPGASKGGCSCELASGTSPASNPFGALGGMVVGLAALFRLRRRSR
jgi:hypothetical protein